MLAGYFFLLVEPFGETSSITLHSNHSSYASRERGRVQEAMRVIICEEGDAAIAGLADLRRRLQVAPRLVIVQVCNLERRLPFDSHRTVFASRAQSSPSSRSCPERAPTSRRSCSG